MRVCVIIVVFFVVCVCACVGGGENLCECVVVVCVYLCTHKLFDPDKLSVGNSLNVSRVHPQIQSSNLRAWVFFEYQTSCWFDCQFHRTSSLLKTPFYVPLWDKMRSNTKILNHTVYVRWQWSGAAEAFVARSGHWMRCKLARRVRTDGAVRIVHVSGNLVPAPRGCRWRTARNPRVE